MPDPSEIEVEPREFAVFLVEQSNGKTHDELSDALYDLVQRVKDTGKKGSIVYTLTCEPVKGDERAVVMKDVIKLKLPEHDRKASLFFIQKDGNLGRNDPQQLSIDSLREVPKNVDPVTGELKEI